jgi:hypothetical protein
MFHGTQRCRESCGPGANDEHIQPFSLFITYARVLADILQCLASLFHCVAYQPHTAKFTGDKNARHIGFKVRLDKGDIHTALFSTKHQRNCIEWACLLAGTVTNPYT